MTTTTASEIAAAAPAPATSSATEFESETCSRCHGSGSYSYCASYGTTCFKCRGAKRVYTKRGLAAVRYLETLRSKRLGDLKVGDKYFCDGPFCHGWHTITAIEPHDSTGSWSLINGVKVPGRTDLLDITSLWKEQPGRGSGYAPETLVRVPQTKEEKAATMAQALAYQATLTKTGKPSARAARAH